MSVDEFVTDLLEKNKEDLEELVRLQKLLEQLRREQTEIYMVSITSNL